MSELSVLELLSAEGLRLLDSLPVYGSVDPLRLSADLRKAGHPAGMIAAALTQSRLRERARTKFGEFADRMLFTEAGLEQSTRLSVGATHAGRFAAAAPSHVVDLGCGIGGDALALAALDLPVLAIERDAVTATVAAFNLAPFPTAEVRSGDAEETTLDPADAVFLDPARRTVGAGRGRRLSPDDWSPSLDFCFGVAREHSTAIKLAPGFDRDELPTDVEAQWITAGGETVELVLWSGELRRPGVSRSALVLGQNGRAELTAAEDSADVEVAPLGRYLFEPAGAVIRARLIGDLARMIGAGMVSPDIAYLTGDAAVDSPLLTAFEVGAVLPLDERTIARELRSRGIGRLEIKKRGVDIDPAVFRKRLGLSGSGEATLILTRVAGSRAAILATRVPVTAA